MRRWSWSKGAIRVDDGNGFVAVFDLEDFWLEHGDAATEEIAEFIEDACNAAEEEAERTRRRQRPGVLQPLGADEDGTLLYVKAEALDSPGQHDLQPYAPPAIGDTIHGTPVVEVTEHPIDEPTFYNDDGSTSHGRPQLGNKAR